MKGNSKDFTSIVGILLKAGHKGFVLKSENGLGSFIRAKKDHVWFPALQIIVAVDTNLVVQVRQDEDGWYVRKGRKNSYQAVAQYRAHGASFVKLIEPHFVRFLNNVMLGDDDAHSERSSVSGGLSAQAT